VNNILHPDIRHIAAEIQTGDWLAVYTRTFYGFGIRRLLSRGQYKCFTNHDTPCWKHPDTNTPMMLQIEPPKAYITPVVPWLQELYSKGGKAILLRPDAYMRPNEGFDGRRFNQAMSWLIEEWVKMDGKEYDKYSIRQILRMILRYWPHKKENDKSKIYCTEGTFFPMMENPYVPWTPDALKNESYPAPIHGERLIRQERVNFVAGNQYLYEKIRYAGQTPPMMPELIKEAKMFYQDVKIIHRSNQLRPV